MFGSSFSSSKKEPLKADKELFYTTIEDDANIVKIGSSQDKCYICGRTQEDCEKIKKQFLDEIDSRLLVDNTQIEDLLKTNKEKMLKLVSDIKNNDFLDFSVKTVKNDLPKFEELIPNLRMILTYCKSDNETINDIKVRIESCFDGENKLVFEGKKDIKPLKELSNSIDKIKEDIWRLNQKREAIVKDVEFSLTDYSLYYTKDGHRVFVIPPPLGPYYYYFDGQYGRKENDYRVKSNNYNNPNKDKLPMDIKIDVKVCKICADLIIYPTYSVFNPSTRGY